jgi:quercetin dioxygenase-like cupin family protein
MKMTQITWIKGQGFNKHQHPDGYAHPLRVIEGQVNVQVGGLTRLLSAGDGVMHRSGVTLKAWTVTDEAVVEVGHIQEQQIIIESLTNRITTLEG